MGQVLTALRASGGSAIVTADHGNAEQMWDAELNAPHTAHTSNPVPVILCDERFLGRRLRNGTLRDVAPTWVELLERRLLISVNSKLQTPNSKTPPANSIAGFFGV